MNEHTYGANIGAGRDEPLGLVPETLYLAATMYYDHEATQAEIAAHLGISRATVSRLLAEARRQGIVRIAVNEPGSDDVANVSAALAAALRLNQVFLSAPLPTPLGTHREELLGTLLAPAVGRALTAAHLGPGDVILVSSGRTLFEVAQYELPSLPGVVVAPSVGGIDQPEEWFQTNEIAHLVAERIGGRATYLFAPAMPGPDLHASLLADPAIQRVVSLWSQAHVVLTGIGAAPATAEVLPHFTPREQGFLTRAAGDVCARYFDSAGAPLEFSGSDRLIALPLADLQQAPIRIGVAAGENKVTPIVAAARAGYINRLVTDVATAQHVLSRLEISPPPVHAADDEG